MVVSFVMFETSPSWFVFPPEIANEVHLLNALQTMRWDRSSQTDKFDFRGERSKLREALIFHLLFAVNYVRRLVRDFVRYEARSSKKRSRHSADEFLLVEKWPIFYIRNSIVKWRETLFLCT